MPGRLSLLLRLEDRQTDRVRVSVLLAPAREPVTVEGVALELFDAEHESLSPRLLLPVAGTLCHPVASTVELRSSRGLPDGSIALATAWTDFGPIEASCPTEPCPDLHDHLRGRRTVAMGESDVISPIGRQERCRLARVFAWLAPAAPCPPRVVEDRGAAASSLARDLGLGAEDEAFVRELLAEDDA